MVVWARFRLIWRAPHPYRAAKMIFNALPEHGRDAVDEDVDDDEVATEEVKRYARGHVPRDAQSDGGRDCHGKGLKRIQGGIAPNVFT